VLIQSFEDDFNLPNKKHSITAKGGKVLEVMKGQEFDPEQLSKYRSTVGKKIHLI
jgi:hypothetical protein